MKKDIFENKFTHDELNLIQNILNSKKSKINLLNTNRSHNNINYSNKNLILKPLEQNLIFNSTQNPLKYQLENEEETLFSSRFLSPDLTEIEFKIEENKNIKNDENISNENENNFYDIKEETWKFCHNQKKKINSHGSFDSFFSISNSILLKKN